MPFQSFPTHDFVGVSWLTLDMMVSIEISGRAQTVGAPGFTVPSLDLAVILPFVDEFDPTIAGYKAPVDTVDIVRPFTRQMFNAYSVWNLDTSDDTESNVTPADISQAGWYIVRKFDVDYSQMPIPIPTTPFASEADARNWARNIPSSVPSFPIGRYGENDFDYGEVIASEAYQVSNRTAGGSVFIPAKKWFDLTPGSPTVQFRLDARKVDRAGYTVRTHKGFLAAIEATVINELEVGGGKFLDEHEHTVYRPTRITFTIDKQTLEITSDGLPPLTP